MTTRDSGRIIGEVRQELDNLTDKVHSLEIFLNTELSNKKVPEIELKQLRLQLSAMLNYQEALKSRLSLLIDRNHDESRVIIRTDPRMPKHVGEAVPYMPGEDKQEIG